MTAAHRTQLVELLTRRYDQADREALLHRLGVEPEDVKLNPETREEFAHAMVVHLDHLGRLDDLLREAEVGWARRRLRRLSLGSVALGLLLVAAAVGLDLFSVQARLCRLPVGQPGLADACGALALGGAPTRAERLAWSAREPGSCASLRAHLARFPRGAYRREVETQLLARRVERVATWSPRERSLELHIGHDEIPQRDPAAARRAVQERAAREAARLCQSFAAIGQNRLVAAYVKADHSACVRSSGGTSCNLDGQARCRLEEQGSEDHERCPAGDRP